MRFAHVHGKEIGVIFVVVEDLNDVADLATKWWSGETAEHNDKRFRSGTLTNVKCFGSAQSEDARIGSGIPHFQISAMHVRQRVADHVHGVFWAACHDGKRDERDDQQRADADADPHESFFHPENLFVKLQSSETPVQEKTAQEVSSEV